MKRKNFKIIEALLKKNLRQADLVKVTSISSESRLSRIIHYLCIPKEEEVRALCNVLDLSRAEVLGGQDEI